MGKIYFNINDQNIRYLEEQEIDKYDILLSSMAGKIILVSMNNIKEFPCFDVWRSNKENIQALLKTGYRPIDDLTDILITQNYNICPRCGNDIDINRNCSILVSDAGTKLKSLVNKKSALAKELDCLECGKKALHYFNIFADLDEKNIFAMNAIENGAEIYAKYNCNIKSNEGAYVPIYFDFSQFTKLFDYPINGEVMDMKEKLNRDEDSSIIKLLFDSRLHMTVDRGAGDFYKNMRVELKPVRLGKYSNYTSKSSFDMIEKFKAIGNNQNRLRDLVLGADIRK